MQMYLNSGGDSGIRAFDLGVDRITVQFSDGGMYLYTYASAGAANIERKKSLAYAGHGLNSFVNRVVKFRYQAKLA